MEADFCEDRYDMPPPANSTLAMNDCCVGETTTGQMDHGPLRVCGRSFQ
jgi:hypothetical protein